MSAACRTLADCQNLAEHVMSQTEKVDEGKRKDLQRMRRPTHEPDRFSCRPGRCRILAQKLMRCMRQRKIQWTMKMRMTLSWETLLMSWFLTTCLLRTNRSFKMVSDAVKNAEFEWCSKPGKPSRGRSKQTAKAKAKAKAKVKGNAKRKSWKFCRPRVLPRQRPRENGQEGAEGRGARVTGACSLPNNHSCPAMPVPALGEEPDHMEAEKGRVPAPLAEVPEVPAMPVPSTRRTGCCTPWPPTSAAAEPC